MWTQEYIVTCLTLMLLAFAQNVSFSVVSRSRNRNNLKYHLIAAFFSNGVWYLTFRSLVTAGMTLDLFWWYCAGTMFGSCLGVKISMYIEKWLRIGSDDHLKKADDMSDLKHRVFTLENELCRLRERFPERFFVDPDDQPLTGGLVHD